MTRTLPVCAALLALPLTCRADDPPAPAETVIRLTVRPAPAPRPALKYRLLPELREMNPGNPIQAYLKCFMEQHNFFATRHALEDRERWQTMPLGDLPLREVRAVYAGNAALRQADLAARLDTPDWQILLQLRGEGLHLLLPDVQSLRNLASALQVRFRLEVAERRFDDALVTAQTMLALSRHLGEHPTLIGDLVGVAVAFVTVGPLDEMIGQPGCPNLFWALTDLPGPFIDLHRGVQGERAMLAKEFALLDDRTPMSDEQLRKVIEHYGILVRTHGNADPAVLGRMGALLAARAGDAAHLRAARRRLTESGVPAEAAEKFPALQVVLLDQKLEVEVWRDEMTKTVALPYWQAHAALAAAPPLPKDEEKLLDWVLVPYRKVKLAQARLDQRLGLLRCVEALRMYAAEHGRLPARLADVKLPLPVDPVTGKPFVYGLDGATATVRGTPPPGQEKVAAFNVRYEVTLGK